MVCFPILVMLYVAHEMSFTNQKHVGCVPGYHDKGMNGTGEGYFTCKLLYMTSSVGIYTRPSSRYELSDYSP